jgi:hypothetical protein
MPFIPELFSFPALARIEERRHERLTAVPFFDGLMTGEIDALIGSFAGEPEVHQPVSGRIRGASAFARFVSDTTGWMAERGVSVEDVDSILTSSRGVEEFVLHISGDGGPIELPMALAADLDPQSRMTELRIYFSRWPLSGVQGARPPLLQPNSALRVPDVVGEYHRALAAGDVDAVVAAFEPGGLRPRAVRIHPPRRGRAARLLRVDVLRRRRDAPRALRHRRRRPSLRVGVQPGRTGAAERAAYGRHRGPRPRRRRACCRPFLRRRPAAAEPTHRSTNSQ